MAVVDRKAPQATALCSAVVSASQVRSPAHHSHHLPNPHHSPSCVTAQVLGEALNLHWSSCSRRWRALEQRSGPLKRAARMGEVCGLRAASRARVALTCDGTAVAGVWPSWASGAWCMVLRMNGECPEPTGPNRTLLVGRSVVLERLETCGTRVNTPCIKRNSKSSYAVPPSSAASHRTPTAIYSQRVTN